MSDAAELVTITAGGRTFRCSRRTAAHIEYTIERLAEAAPSARLVIIQGCYNTGVPQSAGTHDFDAVLDVQIVGMDWWEAQTFLRKCGWAAWVRYPPAFSWHIHMVSLGYPGQVGIYVPGQVDDYYRHALGLKGQHDSGLDGSWFPPDIDATVFDYPAWRDAHMPLNKDDLDKIRAIVREEVDAVLDAPMNAKDPKGEAAFQGVSVREALKLLVRPLLKRKV